MIFGIEITVERLVVWTALNVLASGAVVLAHTLRARRLGLPLRDPSPSTGARIAQSIGCGLIALGVLAAAMMWMITPAALLPLVPIGLWVNLNFGEPKPPAPDENPGP